MLISPLELKLLQFDAPLLLSVALPRNTVPLPLAVQALPQPAFAFLYQA